MTKRTKVLLGAGILVVLVVGLAGWWFFIRDDTPAAANLDDARETVENAGSVPSTGTDGDASASWTVDETIGSFDDFSGSWAGYRIEEELSTIGSNTAVGRTPAATGELTIDGSDLAGATISVELADLESDVGFRDNAARDALSVDEFPTATFETSEVVGLGGTPADGTSVVSDVAGELTLHGETLPVTATIEAELVDGIIAVTGSIAIDMTDYGITPPKRGPVLTISDDAVIEFQLFFTQT